ncbi:MAG TPA: hypothetical protein VFQ90_02120 [Stellaceae bacterium]|nr:hypothetical protein [Stellaceae bacterium]
MAFLTGPHCEERAPRASRRTRLPKFLLLVAALFACACSSDDGPQYPAARRPLGMREALHAGHWRGQVGMTEVDFVIDQVAPTSVSVRVSGTVLRQANRSLQTSSLDNYFYDRPRTCKRTADGKAFDCTRYTDMHIDNGLLCGVYQAPGQVYRPCLEPVL